jgi:phospholipid/cholesterol/gamma-HCH transport system ATP-binding protein
MPLAPIIEVKNVTIAFDNQTLLEDVQMQVFEHDVIVLMGLSGSGKTVLLKTIAGLIEPAQGVVTCYGKQWSELSVMGKHDLLAKVGMQFQKTALFDELNAFENVAYPLREHTQMSEAQIKERVLDCLSKVDLQKAQSMQVHELSGGMKLRLSIARAIAARPEILFLDDPTAGLDPINADNMVQLILSLKKEFGATLIVTTHDLNIAYLLAGRIFLIANKEVLETGSAQSTKNHSDPRVQQFVQHRLQGPLKF